MRIFRDLYIFISEMKENEYITTIEKSLDNDWYRLIDEEANLSKLAGFKYYCFLCKESQHRPEACIALTRASSDKLYVANIVPKKTSELVYESYNNILEEFTFKYVKPAAEKLGVEIELTSDEETLEDWVSKDTEKKLRTFSACANKSTGSSHPCDQQRWFDFIISAFNEKNKLQSDYLQRWLIEESGWTEEKAIELVIEYEFGIALLEHFVSKS